MLVSHDDAKRVDVLDRAWLIEDAMGTWDIPTVFIIDDDLSVRESLEALVCLAGWRPQTFASAREFLGSARVNGPSCLLLDMRLSGLNGLELQKRVAVEQPDLPIIFISGYGDVPMTVQAMKAGAFEFLTKPLSENLLLDAIRDALDYSIVVRVGEMKLERLRSSYASLSYREREIMEIAGELGISIITVKAHRGKVMRKMNATSLAELVKMDARCHAAARPSLHGPSRSSISRKCSDAHWPADGRMLPPPEHKVTSNMDVRMSS